MLTCPTQSQGAPKLVDLCLSDPMWGDCPLAALCNYQTYALWVLPRLTSLDTLLLGEEAHGLSEATYLKKQMYYNSRIKSCHRHGSSLIKQARAGLAARLDAMKPAADQVSLTDADVPACLP